MKSPSKAAEIIRDCLRVNPEIPARQLARELHAKEPVLFPTIEKARYSVRRIMGVAGEEQRKKTDKEFFREPRKAGDLSFIPDSKKQIDWITHKIHGERILVLSDIHAPYHDANVLRLALEMVESEQCDNILLNGDLLDFYAASKWETDPRERDFKEEIRIGRILLKGMADLGVKITWKIGNHEERYERYLMQNASILLGVDDFELKSLLRCEEYGIEMVSDMRIIEAGGLRIIHGHEYRFAISNPVSPARGLFLRSRVNSLCGHFHQTSQHSEKDLNDKVTSCWSTGCLCDMHPRYAPLNKWNHGFAIVHLSDADGFEVQNFRVMGGKVYG
jgi:predicted phosphodiesterase